MTLPIDVRFRVEGPGLEPQVFDSMADAVAHRALLWLACKEATSRVSWREFALQVRIKPHEG